MKKTIFILLLIAFGEYSFGQTMPPISENQTEEYAIISVLQRGKKNFISITIGSNSTEEKEFEKVKNEKRYDLAPIILEMEKLNKMGYELFSSSTSMFMSMGSGTGSSDPFYTFVFKKKKQ